MYSASSKANRNQSDSLLFHSEENPSFSLSDLFCLCTVCSVQMFQPCRLSRCFSCAVCPDISAAPSVQMCRLSRCFSCAVCPVVSAAPSVQMFQPRCLSRCFSRAVCPDVSVSCDNDDCLCSQDCFHLTVRKHLELVNTCCHGAQIKGFLHMLSLTSYL